MEPFYTSDDVQFKGRCLLKKMKLAKENKNPRVALMLYGETYRIRTIFRDQDLEERALSFYDNMDTFYTNRDVALPDNDKLECAVNRVLSLIEQLIHSPNSSQGSPKRRVSPCTAEHSDEVPDFQMGTQDEHSPGVRAIEHDFGSSSADSITEKESDAWQPIIVQESKNSDIDHGKQLSSTAIGSNKNVPRNSQNEAANTTSNKDGNAILPLDIDPHLEWKQVFSLLTKNGWKWRHGGQLYDKILIKPGCKGKGGKLGVDFFPTDLWGDGDELKEFVHKNYGWVGPHASTDESENEVTDRNYDEKSSCDESEDQLVDDNSEEENDNDTFEYVEDDTNSQDNFSRSKCWKRMQSDGWSIVLDRNKEPMYLRPGLKSIKGVYGKDFFNLSDIQVYASDELGWTGDWGNQVDTNAQLASKRRIEISSPHQSSDRGKNIGKKKKAKTTDNIAGADSMSNPIKRRRTRVKDQSKGMNSKRQKRGNTSTLYSNEVTWKNLKNEYGWTCKNAAKYCNLHDWYYIRPGFTPSSKNAKIGEHYFLTERDAVNYASEHKEILKSNFSNDGTSSLCSTPDTPSDRDEPLTQSISQSCDGSDEESFEPFMLKDFDDCWWQYEKIPKFIHLWTTIRTKLNVKHNGDYYLLPDGTRCNSVEDMQLYFCQNGLPPTAPGMSLNDDEVKLLTRFASLAHMPKRVGNFRLGQDNCIAILSCLPGGSSFDDNDAWIILQERFGARIENNLYFIDCIPNGEKNYMSVQQIRQAIRSHGITLPSWADNETVEYQVTILLWASVLPLPVHENDENSDSATNAATKEDKKSADDTNKTYRQDISKQTRQGDNGKDSDNGILYESKTKRNEQVTCTAMEINDSLSTQKAAETRPSDEGAKSVEYLSKPHDSKANRQTTNVDSYSFEENEAVEDSSHNDDGDDKFGHTERSIANRTDGELGCQDANEQLFDDVADDHDDRYIDCNAPLTQEHPTSNNLNRSFACEACNSPTRNNVEDDAQSIDISTLLDTTNVDIDTSPQGCQYHLTQVNEFINSYYPPHDDNNDDETHNNPKKVLFLEDLN